MRTAKTTLRIIALIALLLVVGVALFWRQLLTPQQKLRYGLTFEAAGELHNAAARNPGDKDALNHYVDALIHEGNFGRAFYLMDLYGAQYTGPGADGIKQLRLDFAEAVQQTHYQRSHDVRKGAAGKEWKRLHLPAYQALLYLDGYRYAAIGDWHSAKEILGAIEPKKLAPPLRPYYDYFAARAFRLSGDDAEKKQIESLLADLEKGNGGPGIKARGRYNLIAWYLDQKNAASTEKAKQVLAKLDPKDPAQAWAFVKANMEFANAAWGSKAAADAWKYSSDALQAAPHDIAGQAAGQLMLLIAKSGSLGEVHDGLLAKWAENAVLNGYYGDLKAALPQIAKQVDSANAGDLLQAECTLYAASGRVDQLNSAIASPQFASAPEETRAEIRFLLAKLLAAKKQWNAAIAQYDTVASMHSAHEAESIFAHYAILKEVQEPLNLSVAIPLLEKCIRDGGKTWTTDEDVLPRAIEELVPLYINSGQRTEAEKLLTEGLPLDKDGASTSDLQAVRSQRSTQPVYEKQELVKAFWEHYLGQGSSSGTAAQAPYYLTYYDVSKDDHSLDDLSKTGAPMISEPEASAEYLAGLGLSQEATEALSDWAPAHSRDATDHYLDGPPQIVAYASARCSQDYQPLELLQYYATETLEAGEITDPAVARFLIGQAYPTPYKEDVDAAARQSGVDPALIYAVMKKESNFKQFAKSGVGATGLMQLMPATASMLARGRGLPGSPLTDPKVNIRLGAAYLSSLESELGPQAAPPGPEEDEHDALIRSVLHCYNAGPGNYEKWRKLYPSADATLLADLVPNEENEGFAKRVWKYYLIYQWRLANP